MGRSKSPLLMTTEKMFTCSILSPGCSTDAAGPSCCTLVTKIPYKSKWYTVRTTQGHDGLESLPFSRSYHHPAPKILTKKMPFLSKLCQYVKISWKLKSKSWQKVLSSPEMWHTSGVDRKKLGIQLIFKDWGKDKRSMTLTRKRKEGSRQGRREFPPMFPPSKDPRQRL